jgi:hypothetical protein
MMILTQQSKAIAPGWMRKPAAGVEKLEAIQGAI